MHYLETLMWIVGLSVFCGSVYFLLSYKAPLSNNCSRPSDPPRVRWPYTF